MPWSTLKQDVQNKIWKEKKYSSYGTCSDYILMTVSGESAHHMITAGSSPGQYKKRSITASFAVRGGHHTGCMTFEGITFWALRLNHCVSVSTSNASQLGRTCTPLVCTTAGEDKILGGRPGSGQQPRGRNSRSVCQVVLLIGGVIVPSHIISMTYYGVLGFVHRFGRSGGSPSWR